MLRTLSAVHESDYSRVIKVLKITKIIEIQVYLRGLELMLFP